MNQEAAYWIALANMPGWGHLKINKLVIKFYHENKRSIDEFFQLTAREWNDQYGLDNREVEDLEKARAELANHAFLAETMMNEGYELIPITSPYYSKTLKDNLKASHAPALLYVKGNMQILQEQTIAIVGSRNASEKSLEFTDNIARRASEEFKVVVSGFAKGVDKQALDAAINYKGQSIIVLPQGIMTFGSGFKKYYKQIVDGDVLVLSTFYPKVPWRVELAMARNPTIYGLASEIYVVESSDKGGTWSGVVDGLRKNRKIYVRNPDPNENNANHLLIQKGAIAVDFNGMPLLISQPSQSKDNPLNINESTAVCEVKILELLKSGEYTVKDIEKKLQMAWSEKKIRNFLKSQNMVETINGKPLRYTAKGSEILQKSLFD